MPFSYIKKLKLKFIGFINLAKYQVILITGPVYRKKLNTAKLNIAMQAAQLLGNSDDVYVPR